MRGRVVTVGREFGYKQERREENEITNRDSKRRRNTRVLVILYIEQMEGVSAGRESEN